MHGGVRGSSLRGVNSTKNRSIVMTAEVETFQKNFWQGLTGQFVALRIALKIGIGR